MRPNVLYLLFDDLRSDALEPYHPDRSTPHLKRLADTGLRFDLAFAQQSVCSPSRTSFTTGRNPSTLRTWNFLNHFRQATCAEHVGTMLRGTQMLGGWTGGWRSWQATETGGAQQCCATCSAPTNADCTGWTYHQGSCSLFSHVSSAEPCPQEQSETFDSCVSGDRGRVLRVTTLPQHFRSHGYLVLGVGKYYHDEGHGLGAPGNTSLPAGQGMPPMADAPLSWSDVSIQWTGGEAKAAQLRHRLGGSFENAYRGAGDGRVYLCAWDNNDCQQEDHESSRYCSPAGMQPNGSGVSGHVSGAVGNMRLPCDFVTYVDAEAKLRYAAANRKRSEQPWMLIVGFRRPHINWRHPPAYNDLYPLDDIALPTHGVLDPSVDPIAYTVFPMEAPRRGKGGHGEGGQDGGEGEGDGWFGHPFREGSSSQIRKTRQQYYSSAAWADYAAGRVLATLEEVNAADETVVLVHSDHGWHLGEYGMWEK